MATAGTDTRATATWQSWRGPPLTEEQAALLCQQGEAAVVFALRTLAKQLAAKSSPPPTAPDPSTPSGQPPPYAKPAGQGRAQPKGAKPGHPGHRRPAPPQIDHHEEHPLAACPKCHGPVRPCRSARTRVLEDIPQDITPVVTEHTIQRSWGPQCRDTVEPMVPDALPGSTSGLRVVVLAAWLHSLLGTTPGQIIDVFNLVLPFLSAGPQGFHGPTALFGPCSHLKTEEPFNCHRRFTLTAGGLVQLWRRLREIRCAWYLELPAHALDSAVLHADGTGWRVAGQTPGLWCLTTHDRTYYMSDRSRGAPALQRCFTKEFDGVLVTAFGAAYNAVVRAREQKCWPHLLRDLQRTQHYHTPGGAWPAVSKQLPRLIRDSLRLSKRRGELPAERCASRRRRLEPRLHELLAQPWENRHARRLVKRLRRHASEVFTCLDHPAVPSDNHHGERQIRPAVIVRKNSYAKGSTDGAETQAVLMSVFRTLKQRGHNPVAAVLDAVRSYLKTGQLPPLPKPVPENG